LRKLWDWKEDASGELRELKTKLATYVVMASAAGGIITAIVVAIIQNALK